MNETIATDRRSKPPRKRRMRTVALAFLTGLLLTACGYWILTRQAARALRDAIAGGRPALARVAAGRDRGRPPIAPSQLRAARAGRE